MGLLVDMHDSDTIKQALREAIRIRQRDMERFAIALQTIEQEEREKEQAFLSGIQAQMESEK